MRIGNGLFEKTTVVLLSLTTLILLSETNDWLQQLKRAVLFASEHQKRRCDGLFRFSTINDNDDNNNKNDTRKTQQSHHVLRTNGLRNVTRTTVYNNDNTNNNVTDDVKNVSSTPNYMIAFIPKTKANNTSRRPSIINFEINDDSGKNTTMHQPILREIKLASLLSEQPNNVTHHSAQQNSDTKQTDIHNWFKNTTTATSNIKATIQVPFSSLVVAHPPSANNNKHVDDESSNSSQPTRTPPPLCTREDIRQGEWVPLAMPEAPYVPKNIACLPAKAYKTTPWNTWEWQPFAAKAGKCVLSKWNATQFCSLVQHATVAMVGDSLSWEQYASLAQLLGQRVTEMLQLKSRFKGHFVSHLVCQNQTRLVYLREDSLKRLDLVLHTFSPNILILNRGAHYTHDRVLENQLQRFVIPQVQAWQESCQKTKEKSQHSCHLLVRTTAPGHPGCADFTEPVRSAQEMELRIANMSYYRQDQQNFHWEDFQRQNNLSLRVYQEANLTFDVLDGYDINILRPDDHIKPFNNGDCLHSCFPGKMDTYNQLLLHFLQKSGGVAMHASAMNSWRFVNQTNVLS